METEFKVGDVCEAYGLSCEVRSINVDSETSYPVRVIFKEKEWYPILQKMGEK